MKKALNNKLNLNKTTVSDLQLKDINGGAIAIKSEKQTDWWTCAKPCPPDYTEICMISGRCPNTY